MKRQRRRILRGIALGLAVFVLAGLDARLTVRRYTLENDKLDVPVRVIFLSDLHSCDYGKDQAELLDLVAEQEPDLVLLGGDWVDDNFGRLPPERAYATAKALAERWPVYYVCGNHEVWCGYVEEIKEHMAAQGVQVLSGERAEITISGQTLTLWGVDDPEVGEEKWSEEMELARQGTKGETCSILLTHRPERAAEYSGFDVALAGHAHGGQWRVPGLLNGVFAPDQGWLPACAGGAYPMAEGGTLIVSRGLARESTRLPRFYNRPEVVVLDLIPAV